MKALRGAVNLCTPVSGRLQGWGPPPTFPFHLLQAEEPPEKISYENVPKESSKVQGCSPCTRLPWIPVKVPEDWRRSSKRRTWETVSPSWRAPQVPGAVLVLQAN